MGPKQDQKNLRSTTGKQEDKSDNVLISANSTADQQHRHQQQQQQQHQQTAADVLSPPEAALTSKLIADAVTMLLNNHVFMDNISKRVSDTINSTLKKSLESVQGQVADLNNQIISLGNQHVAMEIAHSNELDSIQQYQRRNNIVITGIAETPGESTDKKVSELFKNKLGINMDITCIDRSHRIGRKSVQEPTKPRAIIVKFISYRDRQAVMSNIGSLKGTGVVIREHLTVRRVAIYKDLARIHGQRKVWTRDGNIFYRNAEGRIISVVLTEIEHGQKESTT